MEEIIFGCDWGTSSFRLRLFDVVKQDVIGEVLSEQGIAKMNNSFQDNKIVDSRIVFFQNYLQEQIAELATQVVINVDRIPVIISGMASSSIGMDDVPYARLPFSLDGHDTSIKRLVSSSSFSHDIVLISGVCSENDVMRGEETQLIGLLSLLAQTGTQLTEGILIFPGTHSKHIHIKNGQLIQFNTFMTGELFSIISNHSILKNSIEKDDENDGAAIDFLPFKIGLEKSKETGILNGLFTVRTNQLFGKLNKKQNALYLSGLLIGEELNYLQKDEELPLVLCCGSGLFEFYSYAIEALNLSKRTTIVSTDLVDKSAVVGQSIIFQKVS